MAVSSSQSRLTPRASKALASITSSVPKVEAGPHGRGLSKSAWVVVDSQRDDNLSFAKILDDHHIPYRKTTDKGEWRILVHTMDVERARALRVKQLTCELSDGEVIEPLDDLAGFWKAIRYVSGLALLVFFPVGLAALLLWAWTEYSPQIAPIWRPWAWLAASGLLFIPYICSSWWLGSRIPDPHH